MGFKLPKLFATKAEKTALREYKKVVGETKLWKAEAEKKDSHDAVRAAYNAVDEDFPESAGFMKRRMARMTPVYVDLFSEK